MESSFVQLTIRPVSHAAVVNLWESSEEGLFLLMNTGRVVVNQKKLKGDTLLLSNLREQNELKTSWDTINHHQNSETQKV